MRFVFFDPPSPPGFVAFRHAHGGYGEFCHSSRLKVPTLDLFHCASLLLEKGFDAKVVDSVLMDHSARAGVHAVLREEPDMVAFRTASGSCPHDLQVAAKLRRKFSGRIVFFGPQISVEGDAILQHPAVDAVVDGEAPAIFLELARRGRFAGVPGLRWKEGGAARANRPAERIADLDILPVPRWDLVDHSKYSFLTAQTSWGCPLGCSYCPYPVTQGTKWRVRSVESVVQEFAQLRSRYGARFVMLRDPLFTLDRRRTLALCEALISAGTPILWGCETRLDTLDEELIARMAKAGCIRVIFGVESTNPQTLRRAGRRGPSKSQALRMTNLLKRHGMLTYAFYMIGLPGETAESTKDMIEFALKLGTNAASFSAATPFPGTRLESEGRAAGRIKTQDPLHLTSCIPSMGNENLSPEDIGAHYLDAKARWKAREKVPAAR